jgi:hypothetical protein
MSCGEKPPVFLEVEKIDWSVEAVDRGVRFCFDDSESKASFVSVCKHLGVFFTDT